MAGRILAALISASYSIVNRGGFDAFCVATMVQYLGNTMNEMSRQKHQRIALQVVYAASVMIRGGAF
jgi:hypothetical protein